MKTENKQKTIKESTEEKAEVTAEVIAEEKNKETTEEELALLNVETPETLGEASNKVLDLGLIYILSKEIQNGSVLIKFEKVVKKKKNAVTLSRTYSFKNFIGKIPFKVLKNQVKQNPLFFKDFYVVGPVDEKNKENADFLKKYLEKNKSLFEKRAQFFIESSRKEHFGEKQWSCPICKEVFDSFKQMKAHLIAKHAKLTNKVAKINAEQEEILKQKIKKITEKMVNGLFEFLGQSHEDLSKKLILEKMNNNDKRTEAYVQTKMAEMDNTLSEEQKRKRAELLVSGMINKCCK
jgi:hypothetical protein